MSEASSSPAPQTESATPASQARVAHVMSSMMARASGGNYLRLQPRRQPVDFSGSSPNPLPEPSHSHESDGETHTANVAMRPYADAVDVVFAEALYGTTSIWDMAKRTILKNFMPGELQIGAMVKLSLDRRAVISSFVRLTFNVASLAVFIVLVRTMFDGYNDPQVNVAYEEESVGFELPMVAVCGQLLNLGAFTATISSSQEQADIQNSVSVDNLVSPQSSQGLPAFLPASRRLLSNAFAHADDSTACFQTKNVATTMSESLAQEEMLLRDKENMHYSHSLQDAIEPFFPYLYFDNNSYINTPSCAV
jgi:hypothetical protein